MIKKIFSIGICILMLFCAMQGFAASPITVQLDHTQVEFSQAPIIKNDRTLVPVRAIFEAMGATVQWNDNTKTVTSTLGDTKVVMVLDNKIMTVNDTPKTLDCAPTLVGGSTMVPTRAVAEGFGCKVEWDGNTRTVFIYTQDFSKRLETIAQYSSVRKITHEDKSAVSAFSIPYFAEYSLKTATPYGTMFEVTHTTKEGHAFLSVRSDVYIGEEVALTDEYVKSVADGIVSVADGKLIASDVVSINGTEFMKITYTAPHTVYGITDPEPSITVYMGRKNGVVYTVTYAVYGEVDDTVMKDFNYMANSILIA